MVKVENNINITFLRFRIGFANYQGGHFLSPKDPPLSPIQLYGHSGSPLPNYFIVGQAHGLKPMDYSNSVTVFLHHNKAAGSTVKTCLVQMQKRRSINGSEPIVATSNERIKIHLQATTGVLLQNYRQTQYFMGGYAFGMCDYFSHTRNCSYFTFMRDPFDRVISSYFYCHEVPSDQLCGPVAVGNFTPEEWAVYQGSYFFYQLLINPLFCKGLSHLQATQLSSSVDNIILHKMQTYMAHLTTVNQCWFRQRQYFQQVLSFDDLHSLFNYTLGNLENWFAFVGLTEDFNFSLEMLAHVYEIPFDQFCKMRTNRGNYGQIVNGQSNTSPSNLTKSEIREILIRDPEVVKALNFDILLYNKGRDIFEKEKNIFLRDRPQRYSPRLK